MYKGVTVGHQQPKGGGWAHKGAEFMCVIDVTLTDIPIRAL